MTHLPTARGPLSTWVLDALGSGPRGTMPAVPDSGAVLHDGDFQLPCPGRSMKSPTHPGSARSWCN